MKDELSAGGVVCKKTSGKSLWLIVQHVEGHWGFPKGHVGDVYRIETQEEAAIREVEEETAIIAQILPFKPYTSHYELKKGTVLIRKTVIYFVMQYVRGEIHVDSSEVKQAVFAPYQNVLSQLTYKQDKEIFSQVGKMLKL